MSEIRVFHTHIEVYPYAKGDNKILENKLLSKYNATTHSYEPLAYYIQNDILYLPRGLNLSLLQKIFNTIPTVVSKCDDFNKIQKGVISVKPKSRIQSEAIDFFTSEGIFAKGILQSQYSLNIDTGDGKTVAAVAAILKLKMKAIVITHKTRIKEQWVKTIDEMSSLPIERVYDIDGSECMNAIMKGQISADIYVVNHQTIASYAKIHSWTAIREFFKKIKVGIKVIDESHKFFENTLMLDFFSNVKKTWYITATFSRPDVSEVAVYKRAFANVYRFGEETINYEDKRKHIVMIFMFYHSRPTELQKSLMVTNHGFSSYKFIDYALKYDQEKCMERVIHKIIRDTDHLKGKTLVLSPKIDSAEDIAERIRCYTDKSVGTVHSKNGTQLNDKGLSSDIISSTPKSIGEGDDIRGLRIMINTEPIGNIVTADQVRGRLREFSPEEDTYYYYLVDTSVPDCFKFYKRIEPAMKKKCKRIINIKLDDI